ncbi:hypothetical protein Barb4_03663 [Bacteroidales bacterium Barb4]|nr:hypothetical protein Barb4_03663 [Bacteroidales bacterium Barb4]
MLLIFNNVLPNFPIGINQMAVYGNNSLPLSLLERFGNLLYQFPVIIVLYQFFHTKYVIKISLYYISCCVAIPLGQRETNYKLIFITCLANSH